MGGYPEEGMPLLATVDPVWIRCGCAVPPHQGEQSAWAAILYTLTGANNPLGAAIVCH